MKRILFTLLTTLLLSFSTICFAEKWQEIGEQEDSVFYIDVDSVDRLNVSDLTVSPKKNGLMYTIKVVKTDDSPMFTKYRVRTIIMQFNTLNQIDGRNYRLTRSDYMDNNGRVLQTYGKTDFSPIQEGSLGEIADKHAKQIAISKDL